MIAEAYARMLAALLPPGRVWRRHVGSGIQRVLLGSADELARVEARGQDLLRESDPRTADELLPEFERELGLTAEGTLAERRARVVALLVRRQRVRPVDFQQALAPLLGMDPEDIVVIEQSRAFAISVGDDREIYRFYIYRDPAEPGTYDLDAAQDLVDRMAHSHTIGHVISSSEFVCDTPEDVCDRDRLGV